MTGNDKGRKELRALFTPAIVLLNRLNYTKKFTLLWVVSLLAIAVVVYSLLVNLNRIIQPSQRQLEGIALIKPISKTIQSIQLHRGISTALLSGDDTLRDRQAEIETEAAEHFDAMERQLPPELVAGETFRTIKADWRHLRKEGLDWTTAENYAAHVRLIEHIYSIELIIGDEYALILDPEVSTYYLIDTALNKLPHTLEHLGQIRAFGASILASRQISEKQKAELNALTIELGAALRALRDSTGKTIKYNPAIQGSFSAASDKVIGSAQHLSNLVKSDILSGRFTLSAGAYLDIATEDIEKSYAQMYDVLLPTAETLIRERIARARQELLASVGLSFLIFMLAVYMSVSFYYALVGNIQSLLHSFRTFAKGNLGVRVNLRTRDELGQIGRGFNEMAEGFSQLLEVHREDEARLRAIIDTALDAVVQMNAEGLITGWSNQAEKIFGWSEKEAVGRMLHETIIPPQYREDHVKGMKHFLASGRGAILNSRVEMTGLHRDGHEIPIELSITAINTSGKYEFNGFIRDITSRKKSEELIWNQANYDPLTGLPNRRMFRDRMAQEIKKAHRAGLKMALLYIDLDKFKEVNDTLGHSMGDILLQEAARRISGCVREADTVARLGGDEFTIILGELDGANITERVAESVRQALAEPFRLGEEMTYVSASIGITLYPDDAGGMEDLLKNADQAMYAAKNAGRDRFSYFTPSMQQTAQAKLHLTNQLRGALSAGQFRIHYQPIIEMTTGRIEKAEALIRWQHPERGLIGPSHFIPAAEGSGLIIEIGNWVFRETAQQVKRLRALYNPLLQVSVNVSPVQFCHTSGCAGKEWSDYLQALELPGQGIVIEITEGILLDADSDVAHKLLEFRDAGIQTAIDDFGTGYSSLAYLKKFDIDYLKIDQSFVRDLIADANDMVLSEAIIVMAHKLGLKVIAEGVETEAQRSLLARAGCDYAQGYLFSEPLPVDEFEELLKRQRPNGHHFQI